MTYKTLILWMVLLSTVACTSPYKETVIAQGASISTEWTEIHSPQPLRWSQPAEEFSFHIDSPHQRSPQAEIIGPDGKRFVPEVEFVTSDRKVLVCDVHGFWGEDMYFSYSKGGPGTEPVQAVRMRSSVPLRVSNLLWRAYDPAKVKR